MNNAPSATHPIPVLFFGSTNDSVIVLDALAALCSRLSTLRIAAIITQPAKPAGRKQTILPTPVELWAKRHKITLLSFSNNAEKPWLYADKQQVIDTLEPMQAGLIVSASYGQMIPAKTIRDARFGGLNIHPSLLPRWRGGDPVPWAILSGDQQTGVTLVSISEQFDKGYIYAQKKIPILETDTSQPLRTKLFSIGAHLLTALLPDYLQGKIKGTPQNVRDDEPYAKRLSRQTGFEPWSTIQEAMDDGTDTKRIERKFRALHPWPGVWTVVENSTRYAVQKKAAGKKLKLLHMHEENGKLILDSVQLEGKKQVSWKQFLDGHLTLL